MARLLARAVLSDRPRDAPLAVPTPATCEGPLGAASTTGETAAGRAVDAYFDSIAKEHRETLLIPGSMAGLVHQACEQEFALKDGTRRRSPTR